jgi:hypothetical protein
MAAINGTMMQYFHWDYPADSAHFRAASEAGSSYDTGNTEHPRHRCADEQRAGGVESDGPRARKCPVRQRHGQHQRQCDHQC